jgi:hypothetical protein
MHTQALDMKTAKPLFLEVISVCLAAAPAALKIP